MAVAISYVSQSTFKLIFAKLLVPDLAHHALHLARAPPCLGGARNPTSTRHMASGAGGVGAAAPDIVGSPHLHVMRWLSGCRRRVTRETACRDALGLSPSLAGAGHGPSARGKAVELCGFSGTHHQPSAYGLLPPRKRNVLIQIDRRQPPSRLDWRQSSRQQGVQVAIAAVTTPGATRTRQPDHRWPTPHRQSRRRRPRRSRTAWSSRRRPTMTTAYATSFQRRVHF